MAVVVDFGGTELFLVATHDDIRTQPAHEALHSES